MSEQLTVADLKAIRGLRDRGFAVIVWTPEELGSVDADQIEDIVIERGNEAIEQLRVEDEDEEDKTWPPSTCTNLRSMGHARPCCAKVPAA